MFFILAHINVLAINAFTARAEILNQRLVKIQAVSQEVNVAKLPAQAFKLVLQMQALDNILHVLLLAAYRIGQLFAMC